MNMYPYAYLVWCLLFALVWMCMYVTKKDMRRNMLRMSFFSAPLGPISEYFHVSDYWRPETVTGTLIGPEDVLVAFFIGGISAVIYAWVSGTRERAKKDGVWYVLAGGYVLGALILTTGMWLGLGSVITTFTLFSMCIVLSVVFRPRLFMPMLLSGLCFALFLFAFYLLFFALFPGIVDAWWFGASGTRFIGVPLEEIAWGFLWGMVAGVCYEVVART